MSRNEAFQFINVAHFFDHFFLLIFPTAALAIAPDWGMNFADVLLLGSPLYVVFALATLPAGWLGDRVDRLFLIAVFFVGAGISSLTISFATGPVGLMIGLGFLGAFAALYHPVGLAHVTQIGLRSGRALAINGVFGNMGLAGAAVTTGAMAQYFGWQSAFALPGLVSIGIETVLYLRNHKGGSTSYIQAQGGARTAFGHARKTQLVVFGVILVAALFGGLVFNLMTISLPKVFEERLTDGSAEITWIGTSAGIVFAIAAFAQLPVGELLDRIGARPVLLFLLGGQTIMLLLLVQATGWAAFALCLLVLVLVFAEIPVTTWLIGQYLEAGIRSRAVSVEYVLSLGVGAGAVPVIAFLQREGFGFSIHVLE